VASRTTAEPGAIGGFLALGGRRPGGAGAVPDPTLFDSHRTDTVAFPVVGTSDELQRWLAELGANLDGQLVRAKGIADTTDTGLVLVQIVGTRCEVTALPAAEHQPPTDLVIITLKP
jgi:G3E family GTPase